MNIIRNTELWRIFTEKAGENHDILTATEKICESGIMISKDIIRFFPKYTLHDETHILNICDWMARLLGERVNDLTAQEAALLLMSACCHDIGMAVSREQEKTLLNDDTNKPDWIEYFKRHRGDELAFMEEGRAAGLNQTGKLTPEILRNYIRANHHKRIAGQIKNIKNILGDWPDALKKNGITQKILIDLCESHGENFNKLKDSRDSRYDLRLCAALLRLSDLLDFDTSRAPRPRYIVPAFGIESAGDAGRTDQRGGVGEKSRRMFRDRQSK